MIRPHIRRSPNRADYRVQQEYVLFLACRDRLRKGPCKHGLDEVRKLTGEGDAFEYEAAELLCDAIWPPDSKAQTRSKLKGSTTGWHERP